MSFGFSLFRISFCFGFMHLNSHTSAKSLFHLILLPLHVIQCHFIILESASSPLSRFLCLIHVSFHLFDNLCSNTRALSRIGVSRQNMCICFPNIHQRKTFIVPLQALPFNSPLHQLSPVPVYNEILYYTRPCLPLPRYHFSAGSDWVSLPAQTLRFLSCLLTLIYAHQRLDNVKPLQWFLSIF